MKPTREQLDELLKAVAATRSSEIDCEEFLARVGAYLAAVGRASEPPAELDFVAQHLDVCPQCKEEFDALVELHLEG